MKAKFLEKYCYTNRARRECIVELVYEYRGRKYSIYENRNKGNEPLAWQHDSEQRRIDKILDIPMQTKGKPFEMSDLDALYEE